MMRANHLFALVNEGNLLSKLITFRVRKRTRPFEGRNVHIRGTNGDIEQFLMKID